MATRKFTMERLSEEQIIIWEIKNFAELQEIKSPKKEKAILSFSAGKTLRQSSTWALSLQFTTSNELGLDLHLQKIYEFGKSVHARYWASIKGSSSDMIVSQFGTIRKFTASNGAWGWDKFVTLEQLMTGGGLINDTLTIEVKIVVYHADDMVKDTTPTCTPKMLKEKSLNHMANHFKQLLKTGHGSDFVIRVRKLDSAEYVEKKVHRVVLSSQSPVFETMMESQMSEKATGVVTIEDITPKGLDVLLKFMYTGNLHHDWKLVPEEIVNAADKYNLHLLKAFCDEHLHTLCTPENAFTFFSLAKQHNLLKASNNISEYIKSNFENVMDTI